jgi:hypothetical protein
LLAGGAAVELGRLEGFFTWQKRPRWKKFEKIKRIIE